MRALTAFLVVTVATAAHAETRIAVPDMKVTGAEASLGPILTEIMTTETSRIPGVTVVGASDVKAMLGFEQEKQLLGCADDISCMAEIGGALGVDLLLASDLGRIGNTYVLNLKLIDTGAAEVINRSYRTVAGEADALIEMVRRLLPELLQPVTGTVAQAPPPVDAPEQPEQPEATPPKTASPEVATPDRAITAPVAAEATLDRGPTTWPSWLLMGAGGTSMLLGAVLELVAKVERNKAEASHDITKEANKDEVEFRIHASPSDMQKRIDTARNLSKGGAGLLIVGSLLSAGGLTWRLLLPDDDTSVTIAPLASGGLVLGGTF